MARYEDDLRLDRRLLGRPGWIASKDLEEALSGLPDVAEKAQTLEDGEAAKAPEAPAAEPAPPSLGGPFEG